MPEGDTYVFAAARISPVLVGRRVTLLYGSSPSIRRSSAELLDRKVGGVRTRGKHLMIDFEGSLTAHVHLGMSGRVSVAAPDQMPWGKRAAVRLGLVTEAGIVWILGAPTVEVDRRRAIEQSLSHLGPDLLQPEFDMGRFTDLASLYPGGRTISDLLVDQRVLAGIGNEYKCEVLFLEGVSPDRPVESVDMSLRIRLARRARTLMLPNASRAIRSTTGRSDGARWVYDRSGEPCRRCRTAIREAWLGDPPRITYWCPSCQG